MKIYLIRHGIAELKQVDKEDSDRMLTTKGIVRVQKIARKLVSLNLNFDLILTSPYRRAKETAIILKQAELTKKLVEYPTLQPQGNILEWINWLQQANFSPDNSSIALVGHQPDLTRWAELLIWGKTQNRLKLKKAGIIGLELINFDNPLGECELFLLTSPKWMTS